MVSELCEREEAKLEQEAIERFKKENYPASRGKYPEISIPGEIIQETKEE